MRAWVATIVASFLGIYVAQSARAGALLYISGIIDSRSEDYVIIRTKNNLVYIRKEKLSDEERGALSLPDASKVTIALSGEAVATVLPTR